MSFFDPHDVRFDTLDTRNDRVLEREAYRLWTRQRPAYTDGRNQFLRLFHSNQDNFDYSLGFDRFLMNYHYLWNRMRAMHGEGMKMPKEEVQAIEVEQFNAGMFFATELAQHGEEGEDEAEDEDDQEKASTNMSAWLVERGLQSADAEASEDVDEFFEHDEYSENEDSIKEEGMDEDIKDEANEEVEIEEDIHGEDMNEEEEEIDDNESVESTESIEDDDDTAPTQSHWFASRARAPAQPYTGREPPEDSKALTIRGKN